MMYVLVINPAFTTASISVYRHVGRAVDTEFANRTKRDHGSGKKKGCALACSSLQAAMV